MFSVCTAGPIHQFWAHYTTGHGDGDRMYYMVWIKTCEVGIRNDEQGFLEAVDKVMRWGSGYGSHKNVVAEQLIEVMWPLR